ncbi:MAG: hypothetical protein RXQ02_03825 [Thermoproteus sp.]
MDLVTLLKIEHAVFKVRFSLLQKLPRRLLLGGVLSPPPLHSGGPR